jgi:biotin transport system substrate-specific component
MPVFAGGSCGVSALMGPTGGYLLGFLVQAYLVGWFIERQTVFHGARIVAALWLFGLIELGLGTLWLAGFVGGAAALAMGCYPFLFGDALKAIAVATYIRRRLPAAA